MDVTITGVIVREKTFTDADVDRARNSQLIVNFILIAAGYLKYSWIGALASAGVAITGWELSSSKNWSESVSVISGWTLRTEVSQISPDRLKIESKEYDANGNLEKDFITYRYVDTF